MGLLHIVKKTTIRLKPDKTGNSDARVARIKPLGEATSRRDARRETRVDYCFNRREIESEVAKLVEVCQ
jgi:hypothetical protein